jgi:hypothetical protein
MRILLNFHIIIFRKNSAENSGGKTFGGKTTGENSGGKLQRETSGANIAFFIGLLGLFETLIISVYQI